MRSSARYAVIRAPSTREPRRLLKLITNRPLFAITWAFVAATLFSMQDAMVKWMTVGLPLLQLMFARAAVAVPIMYLVMRARLGDRALRTGRPFAHTVRALTNISAFLCHYYAVTRMPLADAIAVSLSAPLFLTALSGIFLGEPADLRRKIALVVGFVGVVVVVQPTGDVDWIGVSAALLGSALFALLGIQNRYMSATESTELMVFYGALGFLILTGATMPWVWHTPSPTEAGLMLTLGLVSLSAQFSITHAFRFAPVYVIAPIEYVVILWAVFYGWLLFADLPTSVMLAGAAIIVGSGIYIAYLERPDGAGHDRRG